MIIFLWVLYSLLSQRIKFQFRLWALRSLDLDVALVVTNLLFKMYSRKPVLPHHFCWVFFQVKGSGLSWKMSVDKELSRVDLYWSVQLAITPMSCHFKVKIENIKYWLPMQVQEMYICILALQKLVDKIDLNHIFPSNVAQQVIVLLLRKYVWTHKAMSLWRELYSSYIIKWSNIWNLLGLVFLNKGHVLLVIVAQQWAIPWSSGWERSLLFIKGILYSRYLL